VRGFVALTKLEFKLLLRNIPAMFFSLIFPTMLILIFGGAFGNKPQPQFGGYGIVDVGIPTYTSIIIATAGFMSLPITIAAYRERKILKRFMATPISAFQVLISQVIVNFFLTAIGMIILIIVGKLVFDIRFMGHILPILLVFLLTTLSTFSFGMLISGFVPNSRAANSLSYLIYFPSLFLTGATFPIDMMPKVMIRISKAIPFTYVVELLKAAWLGKNIIDYSLNVIILMSILVLCTAAAAFTFRWE